LSRAANGELAKAIAEEGGMPSALWAGRRLKNERVQMQISIWVDNLLYKLCCGLRPTTPGDPTMFKLDPDVKFEEVWFTEGKKRVNLLKRKGATITAHDADGRKIIFPTNVSHCESVLSELREPHKFPELSALRQTFLNWRFYHKFRTDLSSPIRQPQVGFFTPIIRDDGTDLAAAWQTIVEVGDDATLFEMVERAFPKSVVSVNNYDGQFALSMHMPGFDRAFSAKEISDGTLQYLCLLAALLSTRPPQMVALNEPENSIHPDLFRPLAHLICEASRSSQVWVTTHSQELTNYICEETGAIPIELKKLEGATIVEGQKLDGTFHDDDDDEGFDD
jgi:predicted ATPase